MRPSSILALALLLPLLASPAFGAPADDSRPIVQASEILAKIERGEPVEYDGVIVEGDLDISGLELITAEHIRRGGLHNLSDLTGDVKFVESSIRITDSEIQGNVNLGLAIFQKPVNFRGTHFTGDARFSGANFSGHDGYIFLKGPSILDVDSSRGSPDFSWAKFGGEANFFKAEFRGNTYFDGAEFCDDAIFYEAKFSGDVNFRIARFSGGGAYFGGAMFRGDADFGEAVFRGNANFNEMKFRTPFVEAFRNVPFNDENILLGSAYFREAEFIGGDANFEGAVFSGGNTYFETVKFSRNAKFGEALFGGDSYFSEVLFSGEAYFQLAKFSGVLDLEGLDFTRLYIDWNSIERPVCDGVTYLRMVKNFKELEQFEDADSCYYAYRKWRQGEKSFLSWSKYIDILAWLSCGYGVRPGYTLLLGLFVVLISAVYYWRRDAIRRLKGDEDESANFWDAFYFSMMTFTTVGYGDWYPLDRHRKVVMIEGIVGWLTLSLFLVTLANVIIR